MKTRAGLAFGLGLSILVLAACANASTSAAGDSSATGSDLPASSDVTVTATPTDSAASSTPSAAADTSAGAVTACSLGAVTLSVADLGGASQQSFAQISVHNAGSVACLLGGAPDVSLLKGGVAVGSPATATGAASPVTLASGGTATAMVTASTTCDGALSDTMRVTLPSDSKPDDVPFQIRACTLTVAGFATS